MHLRLEQQQKLTRKFGNSNADFGGREKLKCTHCTWQILYSYSDNTNKLLWFIALNSPLSRLLCKWRK